MLYDFVMFPALFNSGMGFGGTKKKKQNNKRVWKFGGPRILMKFDSSTVDHTLW